MTLQIIDKKVNYVGYKHLRSYHPDDILNLVSEKARARKWMIDGVKTTVRFRSLRLRCFKRSRVCVECGLEGTVMSLDTFRSKSKLATAHFNLYAEKEGKTRLMTKDHIMPRSKGGLNHLDNLQTMCDYCNSRKGSKIITRLVYKDRIVEGIQFFDNKSSFRVIRDWVGDEFRYDYQNYPRTFLSGKPVYKFDWVVMEPDESFKVYTNEQFQEMINDSE